MKEEKEYTLIFCRRDDEVMLGMKNRGFGVGKYNGFGGKIEAGETAVQGAIRELEEESGVITSSLTKIGYLVFDMESSNKLMKVHVYETWKFEGNGVNTEEMTPQWFKVNELPYQKMWPDDPYWIPLMLKNKKFKGQFQYSNDDTITTYTLNEVSADEL